MDSMLVDRTASAGPPFSCWLPVRKRPVVPSQMVREYTYAYGTVCPEDGSFCSLILLDRRTECLTVFLAELSRRYPENHLVVVPEHMTLITLPPYSPELNPQECVWKEIKPEGFYNRGFETMDSVGKQLVKVLRQFE